MQKLIPALLCILPAWLQVVGDELPTHSPVQHNVWLAGSEDGSPLIGCPVSGEAGLRLGKDIARALHARFGVRASVVPASEIDERQYHRRTVILLGHIVNNPEILWLYSFNYSFADAAYPSGDGYVIRQVNDPVGASRNALVIGASSTAGLEKGVARFVQEIKTLPEPRWRAPLVVESELDVVQHPPAALDAATVRALYEESLANMRDGELWQEAHRIINSAHLWYLSGAPSYLDQYRALTRAHREFTASGQDQIYGGLEFWMAAYIQAWDIVDDAATWSDRDHQEMTALLMELMNILSRRYGINPVGRTGTPRPRWNHETNPAMAYFYMAEYLRKYFDNAAPAPQWRNAAEHILGDQTQFIRGTDESALYLPYAPSHAIRFAFATRNHDMITSGRARGLGDMLLMMTDNTGRFLGTGNQLRKNIAYYYLLPLATVLNDGRYVGLDRKTRLAVERPTQTRDDWGVNKRFGEFRPPLQPLLPRDETQVQVLPIEAGLFRLTNSEAFYPTTPVVNSTVTRDKAFDKLVFRNGYSEADEYLLLDGFGRGKHLRYDTNAISRFTAAGRVFLIETDEDQRIAERYHNTLTVIRNGRGAAHVPPFAELEAVADLAETGFSRTTISDYAGLNWIRNILWIKGSLFAVLDEVEAVKEGEYNLRCHWNGLGEVDIDGSTFHLKQNGRCCAVMCGGGANIRVEADALEAESLWAGYRHAEPIVQRVRQTRYQVMKQGDRTTFHNVIYTYPSSEPRRIACTSTELDSLVISEAGQKCFCFIDPQAVPAPFMTDARMGMLNQDRIALVQATSLTMNDTELLSCTGPVDVELDLASGTATFSKGSAGQLTLFGADPQPRLLNSKQTLQWVPPAGLREQLAETIADVDRMPATNGPATIGPTTNRPTTIGPKKTDSSQSTAGKLRTIETDLNCEIRSALAIRVGSSMSGAIVLGTSDSCRAVRIDPNGKLHPLWKIASAEPIDALTSTGNRSGSPAVVFGSSDGAVVAVNSNGQELWRHQLTSSSAIQRRISCLASGDVDRDGRDELLVGTHSWNVHCLADDGRELWRQPAYAHRIASLAVGDINDDGAADVLVGTSYYVLSAFDGKGDIQFGCRGEPEWRRVIVADLDGDGQPEIAAANGCEVIVLDLQQARIKPRTYTKGMNLPRATTERFRFDTGDDVGALEVADLDHDGQLEIIAASDSGFIYSFDSQGQLLQLRSAGDAVRTLAIGRNEFTEPVIAAGLRDGQILVLDKTLKPLGRGKLHDTPHWLSVSDDGTSVRCATRHSVGLVVLNQSNAN